MTEESIAEPAARARYACPCFCAEIMAQFEAGRTTWLLYPASIGPSLRLARLVSHVSFFESLRRLEPCDGYNSSLQGSGLELGAGCMLKFIYIQTGTAPIYKLQLRHSISTLLAEVPEASGNIIVYTDDISSYISDSQHISAIDISNTLSEMTRSGRYFFRVKQCLLLDALRRFNCACVLLDADTFIRKGFAQSLATKSKRGAVMDRFCKLNPYPVCANFETKLPSGKVYRYDTRSSVMFNSGLVAVQPAHAAIIEDSIAITDAILPIPINDHTQEQLAISEALRIHGVHTSAIGSSLKHYWSRWQKRYMNLRLQRDPALSPTPVSPMRPSITVNKPIGWLFKHTVKYTSNTHY
jgi:hypothetical protein